MTAVTPLKRPYPTHSQGLSRSEHPTLTNGMYVEHVGEPYGVHSRDGNAGVAPQTIWPGSDRYVLYFLVMYTPNSPFFGLTQEWFRALSFSRLECEVHDRLHNFYLPPLWDL